jgi:hypothetical protein
MVSRQKGPAPGSILDPSEAAPGSIEPASLEIRLLANSRPGRVPARVLMRILILHIGMNAEYMNSQ